jgi:hypothetical protein
LEGHKLEPMQTETFAGMKVYHRRATHGELSPD